MYEHFIIFHLFKKIEIRFCILILTPKELEYKLYKVFLISFMKLFWSVKRWYLESYSPVSCKDTCPAFLELLFLYNAQSFKDGKMQG